MNGLLKSLGIDLHKPMGYLKVFAAACIMGFVAAFVKDIFGA